MKAKGTQYSPVIKTKGTQCSPIINPIVIRPNCPKQKLVFSTEGGSNASASIVSSIISNRSKAQSKPTSNNNPFQLFGGRNQQNGAGADTYTSDKINQAFQNLFGGALGGNVAMPTPQFNDNNKHQIKAKPIYSVFDTPGNLLNNKPSANARSVFSPIPCKPQSECSILGVRGDKNTPYTPFTRQQELGTPRVPSNLAGAMGQKRGDIKKQIGSQAEDAITPAQFLSTAQPVGNQINMNSLSRATPRNPTHVYNLYSGQNSGIGAAIQSPFIRRQTPKQFRMQAQPAFGGNTASPPRQTTIINLYN